MKNAGLVALAVFASVAVSAACSNRIDYRATTWQPPPDGTRRSDAGTPVNPPTPGQPNFGETVTQADPPPPISGGTLLIAKDGTIAIAADPDRDEVSIVDLDAAKVRFVVPLQLHDEPGRSAEDGAARVHVALRRGGALVTIDLATGTIVERRAVCPEPRGVTYDPETDLVHVACETGELVSLPASGGEAVRVLHLQRHLRDVWVQSDHLLVSNFHDASLTTIDKTTGALLTRDAPLDVGGAPTLAWRTVPSAGGPIMLHQMAAAQPIDASNSPSTAGYGGTVPCVSVASNAVTVLRNRATVPIPFITLAVDIAVAADGDTVLVAVPSSVKTKAVRSTLLQFSIKTQAESPCIRTWPPSSALDGYEVTSVAFDGLGRSIALSREPAALFIVANKEVRKVSLSDVSREDTGHAIFHANAGPNIACASCHGEGGDDAHTWGFRFTISGSVENRRTPSLRGTVAGTAPYHWRGDMPDVTTLSHTVLTQRMKGPDLTPDQVAALERWIGSIPAPAAPAPNDPAGVQRGEDLFRGIAKCVTCHSGERLTNNDTVDVGTGGGFQVPSLLGVGARTPLMHDGCATTVRARFKPGCGGTAHGATAKLTSGQLDDLAAYLETL